MNPADFSGCQVFPACRAGSIPRLALPPRSSGLASLQWLHPRPHRVPRPPGDCIHKSDCESERGWRVGSCFIISPNPRGKTSRAKTAFPVRSRTPRPKSEASICGLRLTALNFAAAAANLPPSPSHPWRSPAPGLTPPQPPQRGGSGSHTTPASPAPSWLTRRAQPHMARLPVPGHAGLPRAPGAIFLERLRAPPGRALLTCVFFIRKGSAAIQPRQRCGDSV